MVGLATPSVFIQASSRTTHQRPLVAAGFHNLAIVSAQQRLGLPSNSLVGIQWIQHDRREARMRLCVLSRLHARQVPFHGLTQYTSITIHNLMYAVLAQQGFFILVLRLDLGFLLKCAIVFFYIEYFSFAEINRKCTKIKYFNKEIFYLQAKTLWLRINQNKTITHGDRTWKTKLLLFQK